MVKTGEHLDPAGSDATQADIAASKRRAIIGSRTLMLRRVVVVIIQFLSMVTVSRLLAPREFGLAAMSNVVFSFINLFCDFGMTNALMRKGHISPDEISLIFWFNISMTTILAVTMALSAPFIADFYHEPEVYWIVLTSLIGFAVSGFALQHRALMIREMRFPTLATIEIGSMVAGFVVTLILAFQLRSVWALVLGMLLSSVMNGIGYIVMSGWRPGPPKWRREYWDVIRFGLNSSVYSVALFLSNNAATFIIGHLLNSQSLGQYNRAQQLYSIPRDNLAQPITQSTLPLMNRLRPFPDEYRSVYLSMVRRLSVFLTPLAVIQFFVAVPLVLVLLGPNWRVAGDIFAALSPAFAVMGAAYCVGDLFVTQNRAAELRNLGLLDVSLRVGAILYGSSFGVVGAAWGFSLSTVVAAVLRICIAGRKGPISIGVQMQAALCGVMPALGALSACLVISLLTLPRSALVQAVVIGCSGLAGAALGVLPSRNARIAVVELCELFGLDRLVGKLFRVRA